jgi:molybdate transport system substrate-binding protein
MTTIKVMSAGAVQAMVTALGGEFERESGHRVSTTFNTAGALRESFLVGDIPDVLILPASSIEVLEKSGHFIPGSRIDLGRTVTGVVVRAASAAPDISTPEAFKRALLSAKSVSYTDPKAGGSSGNFFVGLLERLGIADEIARKAVMGKRGHDVARLVADGRAELGTTFISEILTVPGAQVVGPLPGDLHNANTYTAAIPARAAEQEGARALIAKLTDPATRARWIQAGFEPAF